MCVCVRPVSHKRTDGDKGVALEEAVELGLLLARLLVEGAAVDAVFRAHAALCVCVCVCVCV